MIETYMIAAMQLSVVFCASFIILLYVALSISVVLSYALQVTRNAVQMARTTIRSNLKRSIAASQAPTLKLTR